MLISGIRLTPSITSVLHFRCCAVRHGPEAELLEKRIVTRQSEENVHDIRNSKMVISRCLMKLRVVSTVFAALPPGLAEALVSNLLALETLATSASSGPCFKGVGPSDAGSGRRHA